VTGLGIDATFDHVAMAVPRIVDALPLYRDLLGGEFHSGGDNVRVGYRAIQLRCSGGKVEILEPLAGSAFLDSFLAKHPAGGLHHVTYLVPDLRHAIDATERAGYTVHGEYTDDDYWQEVFVHPRQANGVLLQLAQPGADYGPDPYTLEDVLAGKSRGGTGDPSPGA
jgi:methylmalonyl-CoA/ethylmalonyl-CoA epimerase